MWLAFAPFCSTLRVTHLDDRTSAYGPTEQDWRPLPSVARHDPSRQSSRRDSNPCLSPRPFLVLLRQPSPVAPAHSDARSPQYTVAQPERTRKPRPGPPRPADHLVLVLSALPSYANNVHNDA